MIYGTLLFSNSCCTNNAVWRLYWNIKSYCIHNIFPLFPHNTHSRTLGSYMYSYFFYIFKKSTQLVFAIRQLKCLRRHVCWCNVQCRALQNNTCCSPFLARRILPRRCASCLLEPPCEDICMRTLASGKSNELSATYKRTLKPSIW